MPDHTQHVLDAIDHALDDRTVSGDAMRWTPAPRPTRPTSRRSLPPIIPPDAPRLDPEAVAVAWRALTETAGAAVDALSYAFTKMCWALADALPKIEATRDALRDAGVLPEEPPTEPRARALWLARNRNTGPARATASQRPGPRTLTR